MLKLALVIALLGAGAPCFSSVCMSHPSNFLQRTSLFSLREGHEALLSGNSRLALVHFHYAFQHVNTSYLSYLPLEILIAFGQVIAYDHQGNRPLCKQAIGTLILAIQNWDTQLNSDSDSRSYSSTTLSSSYTSYSEDDCLQNIQDFFISLISIAPSSDVKELLTDLSSAYIEDFCPYFNNDNKSF